jgi:hypothetical protein
MGTGLFLLTGVPLKSDRWQFGWAVFVKFLWAMEYLYLAVVFSVPWDWLRSITWGMLALTVLLVSAWPEPPKYMNNDDIISRAENGHKL